MLESTSSWRKCRRAWYFLRWAQDVGRYHIWRKHQVSSLGRRIPSERKQRSVNVSLNGNGSQKSENINPFASKIMKKTTFSQANRRGCSWTKKQCLSPNTPHPPEIYLYTTAWMLKNEQKMADNSHRRPSRKQSIRTQAFQ